MIKKLFSVLLWNNKKNVFKYFTRLQDLNQNHNIVFSFHLMCYANYYCNVRVSVQ